MDVNSKLIIVNSRKNFSMQPEKTNGTIKDQLAAVAPTLDKLMKLKEERIKEFSDVQSQIQKICGEIAGMSEQVEHLTVDESDLSLKKLDEFQSHLQELQKEKVAFYSCNPSIFKAVRIIHSLGIHNWLLLLIIAE